MFSLEKVLVEKVVFKGRDKVMAEEIKVVFFLVLVVGGQRLHPSQVPETQQGLS